MITTETEVQAWISQKNDSIFKKKTPQHCLNSQNRCFKIEIIDRNDDNVKSVALILQK